MFDFLTASGRRKRFAERAMKRLRSMGWPHPIRYDPETFALELGGEARRIALGETFQVWSSYPRGERDAALSQGLGYVFEPGPPPPFEEAKALLIPAIRARGLTEAMLFEPADDARSDLDGAWRPFGDHLVVLVAIERPHSLTIVNAATLAGWGVSFDAALEAAMANLRDRPPPAFEPGPGGFFAAAAIDDNCIARLLLPQLFGSLGLKGAPVVVAGACDCVAVAGSEDPEALEAMKRFVEAVLDDHPRPISYAPMILEQGVWRPCAPAPASTAIGVLQLLQQAHDYEQQRPLILGRLARQDRPPAVAAFTLVPDDGGAGPFSLALWVEASCLLPKADQILVRTGRDVALVRAWADVEAACGGFQREPDTASPYYIAEAWPDEAAMARIEAAPEPAWSRGKGVGVAGGRLSIFG